MSCTVLIKCLDCPPVSNKEILRYAGCKDDNNEVSTLLCECISEAEKCLSYRVCYCKLVVKIDRNICDFGVFKVESSDLAKNLSGCIEVIVFCATVGTMFDRLIAKYERIMPSKAVLFQAIGSERVEAVCDSFCDQISRETGRRTKPRFSAGYGDLPLELQSKIFALLSCEKNIGVTLNDSFFMSPSKSVTAFVGLCD